jgi:ubiquinone/menaquinone biosynthesis C-methylase UbiE
MNSTRAAYDLWAPSYPPRPHNPLMRAEQIAMRALWPDVAGRRILDLACGSGRYAAILNDEAAGEVVALDFSAAMLQQVSAGLRVRADMTRLPFVRGAFDVVICGLALGHAQPLAQWMQEIARVLKPRGCLLYSDFHPEAASAGLTRSFRDQQQRTHSLPHHAHSTAAQFEAAESAGLVLDVVRELRVGIEFREAFPDADAFYQRHHGLPLLLVVRAHRS